MPELPEMETYKNLLTNRILNIPITEVIVNREKSINIQTQQFINEVTHKKVISIDRSAKHLIFKLDHGKSLLLHLMLGGWMFVGNESECPKRTKQIVISFRNDKLYFIGLRLGYLYLFTNEELESEIGDLGPEPLAQEFTLNTFEKMTAGRRGMLKTTLLNQKFVSGIGNCYSDEICFQAGVLPTRKLNDLSTNEVHSLYHSIQKTLKEAIKLGGYMDNKLFEGDQLTGGYNDHCKVYDREGEPCINCKSLIVKETISSRKSFYCLNCQQ